MIYKTKIFFFEKINKIKKSFDKPNKKKKEDSHKIRNELDFTTNITEIEKIINECSCDEHCVLYGNLNHYLYT